MSDDLFEDLMCGRDLFGGDPIWLALVALMWFVTSFGIGAIAGQLWSRMR